MLKKYVLLLFTFILVACGTNTPDHNYPPPSKGSYLFEEEIKEDLKFEIQLNQTEAEIVVTAKVTNIGDTDFIHVFGSSSCPSPLKIRVESQQTGYLLLEKQPTELRPCTDDLGIGPLKPSDSLTMTATFLRKEVVDSSVVEASGGIYDVIVSIQPADETWMEWFEPLEVKTEIFIEGTGQTLIDKATAEKIAESNAEVQAWINAHSGESIAKIENGEHYILWYDGWQKMTKEKYDLYKDGIYQEEKQIRFENGIWSIEYLSKLGQPPHRITILIDAVTGEIISVEKIER